MADVIVVGGGIVGAAVAYRLALSGVDVALVEAAQPGAGTSGTSFAWINSNRKEPLPYYRLNRAGMAEHVLLRQELGGGGWLHLDGNVEWNPGAEGAVALHAKVARLRERGYAIELLTRSELRSIDAALLPPDDVEEIAFYPEEGYVDVLRLIDVLLAAAREAGAVVKTGCRVVEIATVNGRAAGVITPTGHLAADVVISCVGRWTDQLAATVGIRVPMAPTFGLLCISRPAPVSLRAVLHTPTINVRPDGAGRIMMHADDLDEKISTETPMSPESKLCTTMLERATRVVPGLTGSTVEVARVGVRALPSDGLPVVGSVPGLDALYVVCTHSGVTLGPLLGRLVAREIVAGEQDPRLAAFRPERLVG